MFTGMNVHVPNAARMTLMGPTGTLEEKIVNHCFMHCHQ